MALPAAAAAPVFLVAAAAPLPVAVLAPPLDRPMLLVSEQVRTIGGVDLGFRAERRVVFRRVAGALVAEVMLLHVDGAGPDEVVPNFRLMMAPLIGRALRFHLAPDGRVTGMDDAEAAWDAYVGGYRAMIPDPNPEAPLAARRPETVLQAVPPALRAVRLAEALAPVLAPADALLPVGERPATIAAAMPAGAPLTGTRRVTRDPGGRIAVDTTVAAPDGSATLSRHRVVDPATGLAAEQRETTTRRLGKAEQTVVTITRLTPMVL